MSQNDNKKSAGAAAGTDLRGAGLTRVYLDPAMIGAVRSELAGAAPGEEFTAPVFDGRNIRALFLRLCRAATVPAGDTGRMAFALALGEMLARLCDGRAAGPLPASDGVLRARD